MQPDSRKNLVMVLLFLIAIVSYADRQIIALLKPELDQTFGWSASDYASISSWSQATIAFSLLISGWLVDLFGVRVTLGTGVAGWSMMTALHAAARNVSQFLLVRVGLGLFEGAATPAMTKAVSASFPVSDRGRVIGLLNAAPNLAAMLTPVMVACILPVLGWQWTFVVVGMLGFGCAVPWLLLRQAQPDHVVASEVVSKAAARSRSTSSLSATRMIAGFAFAKFITDPVWWFMLFWLPDILHHRFGLDSSRLGFPLAVAYAMAAIGSLLGGYLPGVLGKKRQSREASRRLVMGVAALCVVPLPIVLNTQSLELAVLVCGLALGAHQAFAANLFGFVSEWLPQSKIGRGTGVGAFCGNIGGALGLRLVGGLMGHANGLATIMLYCASAYVVAWIMLLFVVPHRHFADGAQD